MLPFTKKFTEVTVDAARLDSLLCKENVPLGERILIKLDVQGAELNVLKGCESLLARVTCVVCEINLVNIYEKQSDLVEIILLLKKFGMDFSGIVEQFHTKNGLAIYFDAVFLRKNSEDKK